MNFGLLVSLVATIASIVSLTRLAIREHVLDKGKTLSELGARNKVTLLEFRIILWSCGMLFILAMYLSILPALRYPVILTIVWSITALFELLVGLVPARTGTTEGSIHNFIAFVMGPGMMVMTYAFAIILNNVYQQLEVVILVMMFILGILALSRKEHFLYFELPFIFLSHISIVIAAISLN